MAHNVNDINDKVAHWNVFPANFDRSKVWNYSPEILGSGTPIRLRRLVQAKMPTFLLVVTKSAAECYFTHSSQSRARTSVANHCRYQARLVMDTSTRYSFDFQAASQNPRSVVGNYESADCWICPAFESLSN